MSDLPAFVAHHALPMLFAFVLIEQLGLPLPAAPVMVGVGALAAAGRVSLGLALAVSVAAVSLTDAAWFALGRWRGARVLSLLCRISLEPDSCVRRTENLLGARGASALLFAKFVPGLATVAPPMAGLIRMRRSRFFLWDAAGALAWSLVYLGLGWFFGPEIRRILDVAGAAGSRLALFAGVGAALYVGWKFAQRRRFLRGIRMDRITPEELRRRLEAGEEVTIVDLRRSPDFDAVDETLPGAVRASPERMDEDLASLAPDREVVLFCT